MSRYSYKVEKLLNESNRPSLRILLEDEKEKEEKDKKEDLFDMGDKEDQPEEESKPESQEEESPLDSKESDDQEEPDIPDVEAESEGAGTEEIKSLLQKIENLLQNDSEGQEDIRTLVSKTLNKIYNFPRRLRGALNNLQDNLVSDGYNYKYIKNGISDFIILNEDRSNIEDKLSNINVEDITSEEVQELFDDIEAQKSNIKSPRKIASFFFNQIDKFTLEDVAKYILEQVASFLSEFDSKESEDVLEKVIEQFASEVNLNINFPFKDLASSKNKAINKNKIPDADEIVNICLKYYKLFDKKDVALYYLRLAEEYFADVISEDKEAKFNEFLEAYIDYLQRDGIDIESHGAYNSNYRVAAGAKASAGG